MNPIITGHQLLTNIFPCIKNPIVQSITDIPSVLKNIKQGKFKDKITESRTYGKGHPIFEQNKIEIPTFTPNGTFNQRRAVKNLLSLNGLIYLDIDSGIDIKQLNDLPFIYSYWRSFSGNGYGLLVRNSGLTSQNFKSRWSYLEKYFSAMNITLDPYTKDISRQCVISSDSELYINMDITPLTVPRKPEINTTNTSYTISTTLPDYPTDRTYQDKIKYHTTLDDYGDNDYVVIEDGKEYRNAFVPKVIEEGKRHYWLCAYTSSILFNNPSITIGTLENILYKVNQQHCRPKLIKEEVHSFTLWSFRKHRNHLLKIKTKRKRIWINPDKKFTTQQKRKIIGQEIGKLRRRKTINELISVYKQLSNQYPKVTQKLLEQHSTIKIRTIKKYWNDIKQVGCIS